MPHSPAAALRCGAADSPARRMVASSPRSPFSFASSHSSASFLMPLELFQWGYKAVYYWWVSIFWHGGFLITVWLSISSFFVVFVQVVYNLCSSIRLMLNGSEWMNGGITWWKFRLHERLCIFIQSSGSINYLVIDSDNWSTLKSHPRACSDVQAVQCVVPNQLSDTWWTINKCCSTRKLKTIYSYMIFDFHWFHEFLLIAITTNFS